MRERSSRRGRAVDGSALAARNREIVDLRRQGLTLAAIGERFGLTRQRVAQIIDAAGRTQVAEVFAARNGQTASVAETRSQEILEQWRAGLAPAEIASELELAGWTVRDVIERRASPADRAARARAQAAARERTDTDQTLIAPEHNGQAVADRRAQVRKLAASGLSPSQIAVRLDSHVYTVYGDLAWFRAVDGLRSAPG